MNGLAAALGDLRQRDAQFAVDERRARLRRVAGARQADDAREAAVAALDQMKARLASGATRRFLAGDEHAVALATMRTAAGSRRPADRRRSRARRRSRRRRRRGEHSPASDSAPKARPSSRKTRRTSSAKSPISDGSATAWIRERIAAMIAQPCRGCHREAVRRWHGLVGPVLRTRRRVEREQGQVS